MLHKALSASADVEMHHEYMVHIVQPLGGAPLSGPVDGDESEAGARRNPCRRRPSTAKRRIGAIRRTSLSWLIPELAELLPQAKFVHLVRDGRKVAGSYFHKLGDECYDDRSTAILRRHIDDPLGTCRRRRRKNIGGRCRVGTILSPARSRASTNSNGSPGIGRKSTA